MTAIEKAVKTVSDLRDFYLRIPKIRRDETRAKGEQSERLQQTERLR